MASGETLRDHGDPGDAPSVPPPLTAAVNATRPSAAEEARTIAASTNTGTLATLTATGDPWASFVTYGLLGGAPVLCVSNLAEHGRNLAGDPRASIAIVAAGHRDRPAGQRPDHAGRRRRAARPATSSPPPGRPTSTPSPRRSTTSTTATSRCGCCGSHRVRWVGGYGRMDSATGRGYAAAAARPGAAASPRAPSSTSTPTTPTRSSRWPGRSAATPTPPRRTCTGADRYGLDLQGDHRARHGLHPRRLRRADRLHRRIALGHSRIDAARPPGLNALGACRYDRCRAPTAPRPGKPPST